MGQTRPHKQELDSAILNRADVVVADSISPCLLRAEIHKAVQSGQIRTDDVLELGNIISAKTSGRTSDNQITVIDLTGVAVQDINITTAVYEVSI